MQPWQREVLARSHQEHTTGGRQERFHLLATRGIVQEYERPLAIEHGLIARAQGGLAGRQGLGGMIGLEHMRHRLHHG